LYLWIFLVEEERDLAGAGGVLALGLGSGDSGEDGGIASNFMNAG